MNVLNNDFIHFIRSSDRIIVLDFLTFKTTCYLIFKYITH